jgi:hypothetical protein
MTFKLKGLDPLASYAVRNLDRPSEFQTYPGVTLMNEGLTVNIAHHPGSGLFQYEKR